MREREQMKKIIPYLPKKMQYALGFMVGKIGSLL